MPAGAAVARAHRRHVLPGSEPRARACDLRPRQRSARARGGVAARGGAGRAADRRLGRDRDVSLSGRSARSRRSDSTTPRSCVAFAARNLPEEDPYARSSLLLAEAIVATAAGEAVCGGDRVRGGAATDRGARHADGARRRADGARALAPAFGDVQGARTELMRARTTFARIGASTRLDALDGELADLTAHTAQDGTSSL